MGGGAHSAAHVGVVALLGPMASPSIMRTTNNCGQVLVNACPPTVKTLTTDAMITVRRRPKYAFSGTVSAQMSTAQQRYGAELTRPRSHDSRLLWPWMPEYCA
jgi:hypothetical protein